MQNQIVTILGTKIQKINYKNMPVITLPQVDQAHQRPEGTAGRNFRENRGRFIENEDFFEIPYDEWICLFEATNFVASKGGKRGSMIFLTEMGYYMVVKSLKDDLAWKVQRELARNYFKRTAPISRDRIIELLESENKLLRLTMRRPPKKVSQEERAKITCLFADGLTKKEIGDLTGRTKQSIKGILFRHKKAQKAKALTQEG